MKAVEFPVVAEARRVAQSQMKFFNSMLAAKAEASSSLRGSLAVAAKQATQPRRASKK